MGEIGGIQHEGRSARVSAQHARKVFETHRQRALDIHGYGCPEFLLIRPGPVYPTVSMGFPSLLRMMLFSMCQVRSDSSGRTKLPARGIQCSARRLARSAV